MFSIDKDNIELEAVEKEDFAKLDILERQDLEEWVIEQPKILGEDLLVIGSELQNYEDINERLDVLTLDRDGNLVVIELKRDKADKTTDLQAIKYASYIATFTAEDIQEEYRDFWKERRNKEITPEEVGEMFSSFLEDSDKELRKTDKGFIDFSLNDKPRIMLVAGNFGKEVTSPVLWLTQEYGVDITCVELEAFQHQERILINSRQIIPVPETEEYMAKRREKQEKQEASKRRGRALPVLTEEGYLEEGDTLYFNPEQVPEDFKKEYKREDSFWKAEFTGKTGRSDNLEWGKDNKEYSPTGLAKEILDRNKPLDGNDYWIHPAHNNRTLKQLRNNEA
ncbi:MAG: DUF91 domain-containing protein [Nanohaloarchaea archaeon SW_7_43_1]|nr:MAG: DUF91 domain-containing protein [Nanohaloarchaea archaeon SW_7_43_1]